MSASYRIAIRSAASPNTHRTARTLTSLMASAVVLSSLSACGDDNPSTPSQPSTRTTSSPTGDAPPEQSDITLAFAGDVHFPEFDQGVPNRTHALLDDPENAYGPVADIFDQADVSMVNMETAVTDSGAEQDKLWTFQAPSEAFAATSAANVDIVSLANNHTLDYGRQGLDDTVSAADDHNVAYVGAGDNADAAYSAWMTEVEGTSIAYLGFNQVWELWDDWQAQDDRSGLAYVQNKELATAAVRQAKEVADVVVVYLHWGSEGDPCPTAEMTEAAEALADAGADALVGTHAHLLLGDGWIDDTYVHYGLGNFLWWRDDAYSNDTGVLQLHLQDAGISDVEFLPARISMETGQPIPVEGQEAQRIQQEREERRSCTGLSPTPRQ
ncbi:CapA family protein [Haloglycomyces albus]|uniref:CapA family protein n=1 Tax=Haloglycomyces albus TaxID=526067 RepID=UPI00046CA646|nr:CapA family protein [Haloglycomyces albus]